MPTVAREAGEDVLISMGCLLRFFTKSIHAIYDVYRPFVYTYKDSYVYVLKKHRNKTRGKKEREAVQSGRLCN